MDQAKDIGGTFTDEVARPADRTWAVGKTATTPGEYQKGFVAALATVVRDLDGISSLPHGTTVVLNAVLTADRPDAALISFGSKAAEIPLRRGDAVSQRTAGGGGWGGVEQQQRDENRVESDFRERYSVQTEDGI
jgi:N-methylhydantoinase A/oxoprolinase/acetone carboxylase beta subunit